MLEKYKQAKDFYEKLDIKKELEAKKKQLEKFQSEYHTKRTKIQEDASAEIAAFEKQYDALFGTDALDISTDITVLETMMAREGFAGEQMEAESIQNADGTDIKLEL